MLIELFFAFEKFLFAYKLTTDSHVLRGNGTQIDHFVLLTAHLSVKACRYAYSIARRLPSAQQSVYQYFQTSSPLKPLRRLK